MQFSRPLTALLLFVFANFSIECGGSPSSAGNRETGGTQSTGGTSSCTNQGIVPNLVFNEISSSNDGNAVDETGNADDWLEIVNRGSEPADVGRLILDVGGVGVNLPKITISPGERLIFWADGEPLEGLTHLPVKLKAGGSRLRLRHCDRVLSEVTVPPLASNEVFARTPDSDGEFSICRYATPNRTNGDTCGPPVPPPIVDGERFAPYAWPLPHPPTPLAIDELALRAAGFVELRNTSTEPVELSHYFLRLAPIRPGRPWPGAADGALLTPPNEVLGPGERVVLAISESDVYPLTNDPRFEGVATLFRKDGAVVDRVDFAHWPENAVLARTSAYPGSLVYCSPATPGTPNDGCTVLPRREVGGYVRHLRTPGDFEALAAGGGELGMASVKFVLDMAAGNQIYLVGWRDWSLHYEFVREVVDGQAPLDRCDPRQNAMFNNGWFEFSVTEYFQTTGRRYLLGTLVHHAASDLYTVEFAVGDTILPEDMRKAFFAAMEHVLTPERFHIRPQDADQTARARIVEGSVPIVGPNAPFATTKLQPMTAGVGYGVLTYVPAAELGDASLGIDVIVVTDDVPNDIPLVGGLVTEAFQTPLSHVNVLCQNRGTPNLALPKAHQLEELVPLLGQLVRFEVTSDGYRFSPASAEEAEAFWSTKRPSQETLTPRLDATRAGIVDLQHASLQDLPSIGAKAAQLAELIQLSHGYMPNCEAASSFAVPEPAFALPLSYFMKHLESSGARAKLETLLNDVDAMANRSVRHSRLAEIRRAILDTAVDAALSDELTKLLFDHFGTMRVRMRSSSNAEDLPSFNGAGLYESASAAVLDPDYPVELALKRVWASLYSNRGFDERLLMNVDQRQVAMGVLIHPAFPEERVNGVVISRNIYDITRGDIYTFNAQLGEASVTNPAPGVNSDQFTFQWPPRTPMITQKSMSSFSGGQPVMSTNEIVSTACAMRAIVERFRPKLDPSGTNPYFTMDMEFKLIEEKRALLIKQARPYSFGSWQDPGDCRDF